MDKEKALEKIAKEISECEECKKDKFGLPVPGEGNPNAEIMFIGMSPGIEESRCGKPFVGRSGKFLTELLKSIGIKREDIFLTSPVKYYQGRRNLRKEEIIHGTKHLKKQIEIINPKLLVLLGNVAVSAILNKKLNVMRFHGKIIEFDGRKCFITLHPAAGVRFGHMRKVIIKDFKKLEKILKRLF
jgi:uracil-DNA glycosylase family 4